MTTFDPSTSSAIQSRRQKSGEGKPFTSDLDVEGYVLLEEAGFEPLGLVLGSSVYHIGIQIARWKQNEELTKLTQAMYSARQLAISRIVAEAEALGADGVTAVRLTTQMYVGGEDILEFLAIGTAVRSKSNPGAYRTPTGQPFTSHLTAREFYLLHKAGHIPVSLVLGTCVYHLAHQGIRQTFGQAGQNIEVAVLTQGTYDARELALGRMQDEAIAEQAEGVVGVSTSLSSHVWGEHAIEFFAVGTSIRSSPGGSPIPEPNMVLAL
jgi:uncharacterized protein YbjQ (UPF0145 family)